MKARRLIESNTAFGPETLKVMGQVFEDAWAAVSSSFSDQPDAIEDARLRLAQLVLSSAPTDQIDPGKLKDEVVRGFNFPPPTLMTGFRINRTD